MATIPAGNRGAPGAVCTDSLPGLQLRLAAVFGDGRNQWHQCADACTIYTTHTARNLEDIREYFPWADIADLLTDTKLGRAIMLQPCMSNNRDRLDRLLRSCRDLPAVSLVGY